MTQPQSEGGGDFGDLGDLGRGPAKARRGSSLANFQVGARR